ncbi:MAG: heavy metal translocating P-type ATPase [archaeon]|nr:heavy metal translocating P-type ATPase [archaeon]
MVSEEMQEEILEIEKKVQAPDVKPSKKSSVVSLAKLVKKYPIPFLGIIGLTIGAILQLGFLQPSIARWIWYATLIVGGAPIVWNTLRGMLRKQFAADVVAMLAIIAAVLMDQAFAGVVVVLMQSGGEAIEDYGLRRASSSLDTLLARAPKIARRLRQGGIEEIAVSQVNVGDLLVVRPGDLLPVDGTIISGSSEIDESALTGEPLPKSKSVGDKVLSGSINTNLAFQMRADKQSSESQYSKIVELVRKAQEEKPPIQRLADHYAVYFTPITLAVSAIGFLITLNPVTILAVLVVATPCPLILATPIAVISGINRAAKRGIIVKGGAAIEQIGRARAVAFDKTGTITYGSPFVEEIIPINNVPSDEILYKAACIGQLSSHVVSRAVASKAIQKFAKLEVPTNFKETPGAGVEGDLGSEHIAIGSKRFLENLIGKEIVGQTLEKMIDETRSHTKLLTFVAINSKPVGAIVFNDQIRAGVPSMIQKLHDLGIEETIMLTGDNAENGNAVGRAAGIQNVEANLLPGQKVDILNKLKQRYDPLVMVGDGINDAPALATATVGIAMGARGAGISAEAADMVLLVDDVTAVSDAVLIGQKMLKVAKQGIFIGLGSSLVLMGIAAFGFIPPAIGAMLQEVIDASVILNALRAR